MAWVDIPGSSAIWQYENAATAANSYTDSAAGANSTVSGGIRTHTRPGTSAVTKTYLRTRKKGQQNLFPHSEDLSNAVWSPNGGSIISNVITAPDGTLTGNKFTSTSTIGSFLGMNPTGVVAGQTYTLSVFAKAGTNNNVRLTNFQSGVTGGWFQLTNGTIDIQNDTSGEGITSTITDVGDGWYRCTRTYIATEINNPNTFVIGNNSGSGQTAGPTVGEFIYLWGAMVSPGSTIVKYIKTGASASTHKERGEVSKTFFDAQ